MDLSAAVTATTATLRRRPAQLLPFYLLGTAVPVIALAARGVGPHHAARIINKLREDEDEFYRDVLRQEREYARTQSFWD